jgi:protein-tyrosine phosphatase
MVQSCLNYRDIGGLPAAGGVTRHGLVFRSEGPRNFTAGMFEVLKGTGFRSIIDLRSARERADAPHEWHGSECRWLELEVNADLRVFGHDGRERLLKGTEPEIAIDTMSEVYREIVVSLVPCWVDIIRVLEEGALPTLIHCTAGKDRTGVAVALLLDLAGVSWEAIIADYMRSVVFGENLVRSGQLEAGLVDSFGFMPSAEQVDALIGVRAEYLDAAWDEIARRWGNVPAYFEAAGVDRSTRSRLQSLLVT